MEKEGGEIKFNPDLGKAIQNMTYILIDEEKLKNTTQNVYNAISEGSEETLKCK